MNNSIAPLNAFQQERIRQLEAELGVILIAYQTEEGQEQNNQLSAYVDDPNVNMI